MLWGLISSTHWVMGRRTEAVNVWEINGCSRSRGLEEKDRATVHGKVQNFQGRRGDTKPPPQPPTPNPQKI